MQAEFTVVEPNSKLSYTAKAWTEGQNDDGATQIDQVTELVLTEEGGKTKLNLKATVSKIGPGAKMAVEGMKYGFEQQLTKLDTFLAAAR